MKMKWACLALLVILGLSTWIWYLLSRDVSNAEVKEAVAATRTDVLQKGDAILEKLDAIAGRQGKDTEKLDALASAQRLALDRLDEAARRIEANASKLDRLLKTVEREQPDNMKVVE